MMFVCYIPDHTQKGSENCFFCQAKDFEEIFLMLFPEIHKPSNGYLWLFDQWKYMKFKKKTSI